MIVNANGNRKTVKAGSEVQTTTEANTKQTEAENKKFENPFSKLDTSLLDPALVKQLEMINW